MWESITKARQLKDIELAEVSLVDRPANKQKFLFYKKGETMDNLDELLTLFEKAEFNEQEDEVITGSLKVLSKLDADEREAVACTIVALSKLYNQPEIKKSVDEKWPSLGTLVVANQLKAGIEFD